MNITLTLTFETPDELRNVLAVYNLLSESPSALSFDDLPYALESMSERLRDYNRSDVEFQVGEDRMTALDALANALMDEPWGDDEECNAEVFGA
jgi:hypothetical protein